MGAIFLRSVLLLTVLVGQRTFLNHNPLKAPAVVKGYPLKGPAGGSRLGGCKGGAFQVSSYKGPLW